MAIVNKVLHVVAAAIFNKQGDLLNCPAATEQTYGWFVGISWWQGGGW